jgi:hypothetical protein
LAGDGCQVRLHGTTQCIVAEAFAAEQLELQSLPVVPFDRQLKLERRVSHDGLVSIGANYYSVPDRTRRIVEVHQLPDPRIRSWRAAGILSIGREALTRTSRHMAADDVFIGRVAEHVAHRSLAFYQAIGDRLALAGGRS